MSETVVVAYIIPEKSRQGSVRLNRDAELLRVYARMAHVALRLPPDGNIEDALIGALDHGNEGVRLAAAGALGEVGTAQAVPPLRALAAGGSNHTPPQRQLILQAIADIQSRLVGAEPGQLTMYGAPGGEVSLAVDGGEVSLARPGGRRA